jgi:hypothetical protein
MKSLSTVLAVFAMLLLLNSCKQKGCTDTKAYNFCYDCKKDNGTCVYYGTAVFWWDKATDDSLRKYNIHHTVLVSEGFMWSYYNTTQNLYTSTAPGCGDRGIFNYSRELAGGAPATITYQIRNTFDQQVIWDGTMNLNIDHCQVIQLKWKP